MKRILLITVLLFCIFLTSCFSVCEHQYGDWIIERYPTYESSGMYYQKCSLCDDKYEQTMPALSSESSYRVEVLTRPTCTTEGKGKYTYLGGEKQFEFEAVIVKRPHQFESYENDENDDYYHNAKCGVCNTVVTYLHEFEYLSEKAATCISQGHSSGDFCKFCNYYKSNVTIYEIVEHQYVDGKCKWCQKDEAVNVTYVYSEGNEEVVEALYGTNFDDIKLESEIDNIFLGWYKEDGKKIDSSFELTKNIKVYAKWMKLTPISTAEEFINIKDNLKGSYYLTNDIDLEGTTIQPFEVFDGYLDGKGNTISNFILLTNSISSNYGIFKVNKGTISNFNLKDFVVNIDVKFKESASIGILCADNKGIIDSVNLIDVNVSMSYYSKLWGPVFNIGGFVGINNNKIINSSISGKMSVETEGDWDYERNMGFNQNIGGFVGTNTGDIELSNSSIELNVEVFYKNRSTQSGGGAKTIHNVGGLVGSNEKGNIYKSYSNSNVSFTGKKSVNTDHQAISVMLGNLVGLNQNSSKISECYTTGEISGGAETLTIVGGLVGQNASEATVTSCYSSTIVKTNKNNMSNNAYVGGLIGENAAKLTNSYVLGDVYSYTNALMGGIVGFNSSSGVIFKSFALNNLNSALGYVGGLVGKSDGIITKGYTSELQIISKGDAKNSVLNATSSVIGLSYNELVDKTFLIETLSWNEEEWFITGVDNPILAWEINDKTFHNYVEVVVDATCETDGITYYYCDHCGSYLVNEIIEAFGHSNPVEYDKENWISPSHTECGLEKYKCEHGCIYTVEIPVIEFEEELSCNLFIYDELKDAYYYTCNCGNCDTEVLYSDNDFIKHSYNEPVVVSEATCTTYGLNQYSCSHCKYVHEEEVKPLGHDYIDGVCSKCNEEKVLFDITDESFTAITNKEEFINFISNNLSGNYYLANDIDFEFEKYNPIGSNDKPFSGILYGNGKKIKNLTIATDNYKYIGLFAFNTGQIADVVIENVNITVNEGGNSRVSVIAAVNNGQIYDCEVTGYTSIILNARVYSESTNNVDVKFNYVYGSIAAENNNYIDSCKINGTYDLHINVKAELKSKLSIVSLNKEIIVSNETTIKSGCLVGINNGNISNCNNEAEVNYGFVCEPKSSGYNTRLLAKVIINLYRGTLVGYNSNSITNCKSVTNNKRYHSSEVDYLESSDGTIYKTYYRITDYTVFNKYAGIIGYSDKNSINDVNN